MDKKITLTGVNIVFFLFSLVFIIYQTVFALIAGTDFINKNIYLIVLINEYLVILVPVILYIFIKKANFREVLRVRKLKLNHALVIVLLSAAAYPVALMLNNIVAYFLQFVGDLPPQPIPVPGNIPELLLGLFVIAVSPAICEEAMHRGLLLSAYERRGSMKAVFFTAFLFGIFHFDPMNFLGPFFLGLLIGYYVIRTNSIFAGVLAHFLNNAFSELFMFLQGDVKMPEKVTVSLEELGTLILIGIGGLVITGLLLMLFKRMTESTEAVIPPIAPVKKDLAAVFSHWPVILTVLMYVGLSALYIISIVATKYIEFMK